MLDVRSSKGSRGASSIKSYSSSTLLGSSGLIPLVISFLSGEPLESRSTVPHEV
jgi:hypothetical protein